MGEAFVDDAGLGTNDTSKTTNIPDEQAMISHLQRLAQEWERLLYSTGGALNLQKCFWFLMSWRWEKGIAKLHTQLSLPAQLTMTSGATSIPVEIKRIEPTESFRTLGIYITPDGSSAGAFAILKEIAISYATAITGTHLTWQEALTSYVQYLLPKLRYQPPLLALTHKQCHALQSIALQALLPKLHINRHTARSIVHGPAELGGIALPQVYSTQGVDKLDLLLGHLRTHDRTGQLIHSDLTYLQLLSGSGFFILNQPQKNYQWIEQGWLTSIWIFLNSSDLKLLYPNHWTPNLPRAHDQYIMDYFISLKLPKNAMVRLNRCRLYLRVLTISDIASACGTYILSAAKHGQLEFMRSSTLRWVSQGQPTKTDWATWRESLAHLEHNNRLIQPLGQWIDTTHQHWTYFLDPATNQVYHSNSQRRYSPIVRPAPRTRQQYRPWYDLHQSEQVPIRPTGPLLPVSLDHNSAWTGSLCQFTSSPNPIPTHGPAPNLHNPGETYYATLLALHNNPIPVEGLRVALLNETLQIQCGSNYNSATKVATSTWDFGAPLTLYSHTTDGSPATTRRRAELTSIMAAMYILTIINHPAGQVTLTSNNKRALQDAFDQAPIGITTATQPDYDLVLEIRRLRTLVKLNINSQLVNTPNGGVPEDTPMLPTPTASCDTFLRSPTKQNKDLLLAHLLPSHVITVLHSGQRVTSALRALVNRQHHRAPLLQKLQRDNGWTSHQLSLVNWDAFHKAINKHPRSHRISITKLSHALWNTNQQNHRYYGETPLCPSCHSAPEDFQHVFTCQRKDVVETRAAALTILKNAMKKFTPAPLFDSIFSGLDQWFSNPTLGRFLPPTAGSILPTLHLLNRAFSDQSSIGWVGLLKGHLATTWTDGYMATYDPPTGKTPPPISTISKLSQQWSVKLILHLWQFSKTVWAYRNATVHGQTENSRVSKERLRMQAEVCEHYVAFHQDQHYIPPNQASLFHRPEEAVLALRRDAMASWLSLVEEAVKTQQFRQAANTKDIRQYFVKRAPHSRLTTDVDIREAPFSAAYY